jgi:hypothetical protein
MAAGPLYHWDGHTIAKAYEDPSLSFIAVFEMALDDIWAVGWSPEPPPNGASVVMRIRGGNAERLQTAPFGNVAAFSKGAADDLWIVAGGQVFHWDGEALETRSVPLGGARQIAATPGTTWVTQGQVVRAGGPERLTLLRWSGTQWAPSDAHFGGTSGSDLWVTKTDSSGAAGVFHSDGKTLEPRPYGGVGRPTALWIGARDWGFIGEDRGGLLVRSGAGFERVTRKRLPDLAPPKLWGTKADDIYVVGFVGAASGELGHWDGCRWSTTELGLGALTSIGGFGDDLWITAREGVSTDNDHLLHRVSGQWTRMDPPRPGSYGQIWAASPTDVWFAGTTFVHWDGQSLVALDPPAGLPPSPSISSLSGAASDDVWAVQVGTPDTVYHYDGTMWRLVPNLTFNAVHAAGRNDVWGCDFTGIYHVEGDVPKPMSARGECGAIWSNGPGDIWFGDSKHWDGTQVVDVAPLVRPWSLWGDGRSVWAAGESGIALHR